MGTTSEHPVATKDDQGEGVEVRIFRRLDNGELVFKPMSFEDMRDLGPLRRIVLDDGAEAVLDIAAEFSASEIASSKSPHVRKHGVIWPIRNIRGGCHPDQAKRLNEAMRARGIVGARYSERNGDLILNDKGNYRKFLKFSGHINMSGYE